MKLIKLFLVFSMIIQSFYLYAQQACVGKDNTIAPPVDQRTTSVNGTVVDTQIWKDWKEKYSTDWQARQNWGCCERLTLNATTKVCEDKSIADSGLQTCSDHSQCPADQGCLNWREDDMFNEERATSETEKAQLSVKAEEFQQARDEFDELKPNGGFCITNMQCDSYKCEGFSCKENKICRLADSEDPATPNKVKCEEPFQKDTLGKCINPNASYFVGLLGKVSVARLGEGKCEYGLVPEATGNTNDIPGAINLAIASTRSMEWLMSTLTMSDSMSNRDCVYAKDYFRDKMKELVNERKVIINAFNADIKIVEDNYAAVLAAKENDQTPINTLCDETTTQHDVASRKASGKDFLCYMYRRNELFKAYEISMKDWSKKMYDIFFNYENDIKNWGESNKSWTIGGRGWDWKSARTCRYWVDLLVGVITPKKLKNRWIDRSRMKVENSNELFNKYIVTIDTGAADRVKRWRWMLDPLHPGSENMSVENYLKSLRDSSIPEAEFIHEPEMAASYELRGCITKVNDPSCVRYKKYIEDLSQIALAQKIMYSTHNKRKYKSYYQNEGSGRRRLIARLITDTTNLQNYYEGTIALRDQQNACIQKVLDQLNGADFNGAGTGITQGNTNYYQATQTNYVNGKNDQTGYNKPKVKKFSLTPMKFKLSAHKSLKGGANKDGTAGANNSGAADLDNTSASALASRTKALQDANAKARAKGIDVDKMDKELREELKKSDLLTSTGMGSRGGSVAGGSSNSSLGSGTDGKKATLGEGASTSAQTGKGADAKSGAAASGAAAATAGAGSGSLSSAFSSSSDDGAGKEHQDPTGMSDEEKDVMAANYDRTKSKYETKEDDTLFQVLSKTYVRNLDKILTRKKKLDEGAASEPSAPSTP